VLIATYDELAVDRDLVLVHLVATGRWTRLVADLRLRAACESLLDEDDLRATARLAEQHFRTARGLHAADDLRAWLAARELDVPTWRGHLRRRAAADVWALRSPDEPPQDPVAFQDQIGPADIDAALLIDGLLDEATAWLLEGAAARDLGAGSTIGPDHADVLTAIAAAPLLALEHTDPGEVGRRLELASALDAARRAAPGLADQREVRETITERALDWTVLQYDELVVSSPSAAREALLCVRDDGLDLAEVGERCGRPVNARAGSVAELPTGASQALLAGMLGQPAGPVAVDEGWQVLVLRSRVVPDPDDPAVISAATDVVVRDQLARQLAGRVVIHAAL
jgi:hypothetical protein